MCTNSGLRRSGGEVIKYVCNPEEYIALSELNLLLECVHSGQFLSMINFVDLCAASIFNEPCRLCVQSAYHPDNHQDKFCTLKHLEKIDQGKCAVCLQWLRSDSPKKLPCCGKKFMRGVGQKRSDTHFAGSLCLLRVQEKWLRHGAQHLRMLCLVTWRGRRIVVGRMPTVAVILI